MPLRASIRQIAVQEDIGSILDAAVGTIRELDGVDAAFAATIAPDVNAYQITATCGTSSGAFGEFLVHPMVGLGGRVAVAHRAMAVPDSAVDAALPDADASVALLQEEGLRGLACAPVISSTGVHSLLYAGMRKPGYLSNAAFADLELIACHVGVVVDQHLTQERLRRSSVLRERQRLATSLHDSVAQSLFAIGVEAKRARIGEDLDRVGASLREIEALAAQAGRELRETLHRLSAPPAPIVLESVLHAEARAFAERHGVTAQVVCEGSIAPLPQDHESLIVDTAREGLRNAVKHADARLILLHLQAGDRGSQLIVQSDGNPLARERDGSASGMGLTLLRRRAEALHGSLQFSFGDEGETIVTLDVPRKGSVAR